MPRIEECITTLAGQKFFSLLDLCSGYWQIPIAFGLSNAPSTFQRIMDLTMGGLLWEECLVYVDDILVFGRTLCIRLSKCQFARRCLLYLGFEISDEGIRISPAQLRAVKQFPMPQCAADVQSFVGLAGFSRRFIRNFAAIARPLIEAYTGRFKWDEPQVEAFDTLKHALMEAPILGYPDRSLPFCIESDASGIGYSLLEPGTNKGREEL